MNKHIFYIVFSAFVLVGSICLLWYGLWDAKQPKTGPVGNGVTAPTFLQILPVLLGILSGIINLPTAIYRYLQYKKKMINDEKSE